ncbi:response regulator transcription factor [Leeia oryzae]|uniref:response regulator transcription factor n=1 Tax=Leeia oryzae TaxID=356662 RepID=UPI0003656D80|nr:response regulator transcription factor [Leeia oryzae]
MNVLLIDDDVALLDMLQDYLTQEGFTVFKAHNGLDGLALFQQLKPDMVVLDVMMPKQGGIDTLRKIRTESTIPVIMLTAKDEELDRVIGLELGADDYVSKPCTPRELVARIRAILRRARPVTTPAEIDVIEVGDLSIWPGRRQAAWKQQEVQLTSTEFNLLETLARHAGKPVSKEELSEAALGRPLTRYDRSIDVHLSSIRHKLGPLPDGRSCIQTVFRLGYQLIKAS